MNINVSVFYLVNPPGGGVLLGILGGGVPPGSPNPDPISDKKNAIPDPFSDQGPGKLSPFTLKIEVSIVLHLA